MSLLYDVGQQAEETRPLDGARQLAFGWEELRVASFVHLRQHRRHRSAALLQLMRDPLDILRGSLLRFEAPTDPVGEDGWDALA